MKHLLLTTIAAVLVVGCGPSISIHKAAEEGNIEAVKQHLADGADVNAKNRSGATAMHSTPLCEAAGGGHKEVVELLIAKGADVNVKNAYGTTPLDWAILRNRTETADLLRKHGGKTAEELKAADPVAEAALCKGVHPSAFFAFTSAPAVIRSSTTFM